MMNQTQDYGYSMQPLDKNRKNIDDWRSIGLGVFALARYVYCYESQIWFKTNQLNLYLIFLM